MHKLKDKYIKSIAFESIFTNDSEFRILKVFEILMGDIIKQNNRIDAKRKAIHLNNKVRGEIIYDEATEKTFRRSL